MSIRQGRNVLQSAQVGAPHPRVLPQVLPPGFGPKAHVARWGHVGEFIFGAWRLSSSGTVMELWNAFDNCSAATQAPSLTTVVTVRPSSCVGVTINEVTPSSNA